MADINNTDEYRASVLSALGIEDDVNIRYFADFRKALLTKLGMDFTDEDVRNEERFRLKFLEAINAFSGLSVKTVSGAIASFNDAVYDVPLKSLLVNFGYKASGYEGINVTRCGKTILPKMVAGTYSANGGTIVVDNDGVAHLSGTTTAGGNVAIIPLETPITITQDMVDKGLYCHLRNSAAIANLGPTLENNSAVKAAEYAFSLANRISPRLDAGAVGKTVTRIRFYVASGVTLRGTYAPSLEFTNEATEYEPYQGNTYPISLGQTIYGGVLDVVSGKCISALASDGTELVHPIKIQLTPTEVKTFNGNNNLWADCGDVIAKYLAK